MSLEKTNGRISGKVKFTCPICGTEYSTVEVSIPPTDCSMNNLNIESVVVTSDSNSPEGIGLRAELTMDCPKCEIKMKQFVFVKEQ